MAQQLAPFPRVAVGKLVCLAASLQLARAPALVVPSTEHGKLAAGPRPCDVYGAAGTRCVAAHSTVRALYSSYRGNLYQIMRQPGNHSKDIGVLEPGLWLCLRVSVCLCVCVSACLRVCVSACLSGWLAG